ncbi:MAG: TIGR04282 family arsenosugar biosynthesis glycosyltransferase [Ginsengibacter sp.]
MKKNALIIFVKNLIPGHVKTRLATTLGNGAAMNIYQQLLKVVHDNIQGADVDKVVFYSDFIENDIWQNSIFQKEVQKGKNLGERMNNAFESLFLAGYEKVVIIGTDCPALDESIIHTAFAKMSDSDVVIGPATDGGYYLLGMKKLHPFLFQNVEWSTSSVLTQTIDLCKINELTYFLLNELSDIDEEKDLIHFKKLQA